MHLRNCKKKSTDNTNISKNCAKQCVSGDEKSVAAFQFIVHQAVCQGKDRLLSQGQFSFFWENVRQEISRIKKGKKGTKPLLVKCVNFVRKCCRCASAFH